MSLETLITRVLVELERLNYSTLSQTRYRQFYQRVLRYAREQGLPNYSEEVGRQFLAASYDCDGLNLPHPVPGKLHVPLRGIAMLGDMHLHGMIRRRHMHRESVGLPPEIAEGLVAFAADCERRGYSSRSWRTRRRRLHLFGDYLVAHQRTLDAITGADLSAFVATLLGYHPQTVAGIVSTLRMFLRFLHTTGQHTEDLSGQLPHLPSAGRYQRIPSIWPHDAIAHLVAAVDRGNSQGKRDYAILLLAARLGIRVGDIKTLTLSAFDWDARTIRWVQQKTGRAIEYPLLDDIGWAVIDYLRHGRPPTTTSVVFVRHQPPFEPFGPDQNLYHIITKYTRLAGIAVPAGHRGLHSLRHTVARTLLEHGTALPQIADILGHATVQSTHTYLAIEVAGLQRCALNPEEVFADGRY